MRASLVAVSVLLALAGGAVAQTAEHMGIWAPLYVLPKAANETQDDYNRLISSVENNACLKDSFHGTVLTGPRSGPPNPKDPFEWALYTERYSVVSKTNQWTAFGYVHTDYGKRDLNVVLAEIKTWLDGGEAGFGDYVQGIWVDGVRSSMAGTDGFDYGKYYSTVAQTITGYGKIVAFNPGTRFNDCKFLEDNGVAFVNNFEDYYGAYKNATAGGICGAPCSCAKSSVTRCIASVHGVPSEVSQADVAGMMGDMASRGYKAMFLTDRQVPNQYLQLPTIWKDVVAAACTITVDGAAVKVDPASCSKSNATATAATAPATGEGSMALMAERTARGEVSTGGAKASGSGAQNFIQSWAVSDDGVTGIVTSSGSGSTSGAGSGSGAQSPVGGGGSSDNVIFDGRRRLRVLRA